MLRDGVTDETRRSCVSRVVGRGNRRRRTRVARGVSGHVFPATLLSDRTEFAGSQAVFNVHELQPRERLRRRR